ncbi:MAG: DUF3090 family protein [Actinomycetota bacterium]|jgi:uncharacterized repeat protein (TIGR03847 family)|nr:DUF3090 family protein [Actinomycetota bacterium]
MSNRTDFDHPDQFTVGTEGPVGDRTFLLHITQGPSQLTVKVEKQQVAILASYLARIVRQLGRPGHLPDDLEFDTSSIPAWVVGTIGVSYDDAEDRLVVVIQERGEDEEDRDDGGSEDDGSMARVAMSREQAAAFAIRATRLVEAGRPPCPLCGLPLDPSGHDCPRTNGHRPPVS